MESQTTKGRERRTERGEEKGEANYPDSTLRDLVQNQCEYEMQEGCLKKKKNCFNSTSIEC
jgi:aconitase B